MRFGVLGPLAVWTDDGRPVGIPGAKVRALLAVLLINDGRLVSADRLIEDLWGDEPPRRNPLGALSAKVSQLRRALEDAEPGARDLVVFRPPGYRLRLDDAPDDGIVDARRFQALTARARQSGDVRTRARLLADALALWRGPALADFADEPFAGAAIARLEDQRLTAVEDAAEARLALGEHAALAAELAEAVAAHPFRERLVAAYLRALHGAGRQSEALDAYERVRRRLADELGIDPGPELAALHRAILTQDLRPPAAPPTVPPAAPPTAPAAAEAPAGEPVRSNLPAPIGELIGRDDAVAEIRALLGRERLVTLTGPGGVGKTRLAIEVAAGMAAGEGRHRLPDGVWLAELAGTRAGAVAEAVAAALDIRDGDAGEDAGLVAALRSRTLLLVLDNCEHVVDEAARLADRLLRAAPGLRVLATGREPLGLAGEVVWDVPPLQVPAPGAGPDEVARAGAVRLFVARAAAAVRGFALDEGNAAAVGLLCRRLDGIPLALELAATRVRALGVQGVVDRLDDRFRLLATGHRGAPPRQRTLLAMIDWSWELLGEEERAVLRRLAVHADGCTLDAAEAVCGGDGLDVPDLLVRLVNRSLVVAVPADDGPRYRLLESVAAYCADRLREAGELERTRRRHRDHYLALAEQAAPLLRGPAQRRWLRRLDAESANLDAALDRCVADGDALTGLRLVDALAWYWFLRGRLGKARRHLRAVLAIAGDAPEVAPLAARARVWAAGFASLHGDADEADRTDPLELIKPLDTGRGRAAWFLANAVLARRGEPAGMHELLEHALDAARAEGDLWAEAAVLATRAALAHVRGDRAALDRDAGRSAELFDELGDGWGRMRAAEMLAARAELTGDRAGALELHRDALRRAEEFGLWPEVVNRLSWLGWTHTQLGEHAAALEYGERALRLAARQGHRAGEIFATIVLAFASRRLGDLDAATAYLRRLLPGGRPGDRAGTDATPAAHDPMVLMELGFVAAQRGDAETALRLHLDAFHLAERLDAPQDRAGALEGMAAALALRGDHARAAELLGAAASAREAISLVAAPVEQADLDRIADACRTALGEDGFAAAFARGARRTPADAARTAAAG